MDIGLLHTLNPGSLSLFFLTPANKKATNQNTKKNMKHLQLKIKLKKG